MVLSDGMTLRQSFMKISHLDGMLLGGSCYMDTDIFIPQGCISLQKKKR
jgi:hypothetical protein